MSEFVEVTQLKLARRVWSLDRAYPMQTASRSVTSPSPRPRSRSQIEKCSSSLSSVALVASASSSVASSLRLLRCVNPALNNSPRSALSGAFLQMRRTARRAKSQRNTERFVSIESVFGFVPGFCSPQPVPPAGPGTPGAAAKGYMQAVSRNPGCPGFCGSLGKKSGSVRHQLLKAHPRG